MSIETETEQRTISREDLEALRWTAREGVALAAGRLRDSSARHDGYEEQEALALSAFALGALRCDYDLRIDETEDGRLRWPMQTITPRYIEVLRGTSDRLLDLYEPDDEEEEGWGAPQRSLIHRSLAVLEAGAGLGEEASG